MTMRLQLVRTRYPHWGLHSGFNQYVKHLNRDEFDVHARLVPDSDDDFPIRNPSVRNRLRRLVQKRGMPWYKLSDLMVEMQLLSQCPFHPSQIIHYLDGEHSAQFLPMAAKFLGKARPKVLATYHQPLDMLSTLVRKDVLLSLDCVTVVAPEQLPFFSDLLGHEKVQLVLLGIDTQYFRPSPSAKETGTFKCLTVGHYQRDFQTLAEVIKKLQHRSIEFHVVSPRTPELRGLPNVTVYEGIDDVALLRLYQQAHLLVLPLLRSTANNAIVEAIACGLPVVATSLPSVKAYLPGKEAMLIEGNDPQRFVEVIKSLAVEPSSCQSMSEAARERAEALDWRIIAAQYEAIYSVLARGLV